MLDEPLQLVLTLLLVVEGVQQILGQRHGDFSETFQGLEIWLKDKVSFQSLGRSLKRLTTLQKSPLLLHGTDLCGVGDGNLNLGRNKLKFRGIYNLENCSAGISH